MSEEELRTQCPSSSSSSSRPVPPGERPALTRLASEADYLVRGSYTVDTRDYEDHTFSGIMFDVVCKDNLPLHHMEITHVYVRGNLGPIQIFSCEDSFTSRTGYQLEGPKHCQRSQWTLRHKANYLPSPETLQEMKLDPPVQIKPGATIGLYVHSQQRGDQAIVYNNQRSEVTVEDMHFKVMSGFAHVSNRPFSPSCPWGNAWRQNREFVGRLQYRVKWKLWKPTTHDSFPAPFKRMVWTMMMCQRRRDSPLSKLPQTVLFYIVNFCSWDWAGTPEELKAIAGDHSNSAEAIKAAQEREYKEAMELREEGQR